MVPPLCCVGLLGLFSNGRGLQASCRHTHMQPTNLLWPHAVAAAAATTAQVPHCVAAAVGHYMCHSYAQLGAGHSVSVRATSTVDHARQWMRVFMGAPQVGWVTSA